MKRTPIAPMSRKKRKAMRAWWPTRRQVQARADGWCEACRVHSLEECDGRGVHAHHLLPRSQGGPDDPANLIWVSADHHSWIHAHPGEAYDLGLLWRSAS